MKPVSMAAGIACLLAATTFALAHHSYSMFDLTREATVSGTVRAVEWTNPHVWIFVVRQGGEADAATYAFESVSPGELVRFYGWTKASLTVGDKVAVRYAPLRSGKLGGALKSITLSNGKVLEAPAAKIRSGPPGSGPPPTSSSPAGLPPTGGASDAHR